MKVHELIEELKKQDPELPVHVGVACSCYGIEEATEVAVLEAEAGIRGIGKEPKRVFIE